MIAYLDTSALVPLLLLEPSTARCRQVWDAAEVTMTSRVTYVECGAALAAAQRLGRIDADVHLRALHALENLWAETAVIDLTDEVMRSAAELARSEALRGYAAVQAASALAVADLDVVAVSGDRMLLQAWRARGLFVADVNAPEI